MVSVRVTPFAVFAKPCGTSLGSHTKDPTTPSHFLSPQKPDSDPSST